MDQHGGGIALLPTQLAMGDGGERHCGIIAKAGSCRTNIVKG